MFFFFNYYLHYRLLIVLYYISKQLYMIKEVKESKREIVAVCDKHRKREFEGVSFQHYAYIL